MSSLVAYEDSDSEDYDKTEEEAIVSHQSGSCEPNKEARGCSSPEVSLSQRNFTPIPAKSVLEHQGSVSKRHSSSLCTYPQLQNTFEQQRRYCIDVTAQEKITPLQTLSHMPKTLSDGLKPPKRHCTVPSGVRPYIPKRQRLATSVETAAPESPAEQVPGNQTRESQILSEVSARVKPHLDHKPGAAGIPKRLLMSLGGHQGPVNTVQWCPLPHLSHLLLSASMDKTFKVNQTLTSKNEGTSVTVNAVNVCVFVCVPLIDWLSALLALERL